MIRIVYQWSEDGESEVCHVHRAVTETEIECSHCGCKIPADTPVAKLVNLEGEYLMHQECALKGCALREQRERMREFFKPIIRNRAKCLLCGDIIESTDRHDFKTCSCGALSVDGGREYIKRLYKSEETFEELSELK